MLRLLHGSTCAATGMRCQLVDLRRRLRKDDLLPQRRNLVHDSPAPRK
jgi:hypothetical protein